MAISAMSKDTFWNKVRVEKNIRYSDIVELFGGSVSMWAQRFTGQTMPTYAEIKKLCELFDVDVTQGTEEFKKAHALWKSEGRGAKAGYITTGKSVMSGIKVGKRGEVTGTREHVEKAENEAEVQEEELKEDPLSVRQIMGLLYGKIPYDTFLKFCDMITGEDGDPLESIYGRVSYREYTLISDALKEV